MGKLAEMQRKLLEQMMGPEAMGVQVQNHDWWSDRVCRNYLFGTCPHVLFGNTKMDLGACPKIHSDRVLAQFKEAEAANPADPRIMQFRQEHENTLYGYIDEADRRIRMSQRKLEKTPEENRKTVDLMREIGEIELSIQGGTEEIEALGEAGKVEESMEKLQAVEALKSLKTDKERELQNLNETAGASGHQKLRVCEICGAMLSVLDSDKRLADHFGGKLHLGYQELRKLLADFAEARLQGRIPGIVNQPSGPAGPAGPPPSAPSGPSGAPPSAPSGPSGFSHSHPHSGHSGPMPPFPLNGSSHFNAGASGNGPHTPMHPSVPPADEMPAVGHGDKHRREAGELVEDVRDSREGRDKDRDGRGSERDHRDRSDRDDRYRDREGRSREPERERSRREDRYDKYDKYGEAERSRERGERRSSGRHADYDDERYERYKERKYDDDRKDRGSRYE